MQSGKGVVVMDVFNATKFFFLQIGKLFGDFSVQAVFPENFIKSVFCSVSCVLIILPAHVLYAEEVVTTSANTTHLAKAYSGEQKIGTVVSSELASLQKPSTEAVVASEQQTETPAVVNQSEQKTAVGSNVVSDQKTPTTAIANNIIPDLKPGIPKEILTIIATRQHPYLTLSDFSNRSGDLDALYKSGNYQLLWLGNAQSDSNITEVIKLLENASVDGLNSSNYDTALLKEKKQAALSLNADAYQDLARFDTAISLSLLRFLHDLHYGRINPQGININLKLREKKLIDLSELIKTNLAQATLARLPELVEPKLAQYQKLKQALATYRTISSNSKPFTLNFTGTIRPGSKLAQAEDLRQFLINVGDIQENNAVDKPRKATSYSGDIVNGMKMFQKQHGLNADGSIGKSTAEAINVSLGHRVTQIELAMERLRWLPEINAGPAIIVNIPAFQLWTFEDFEQAKPANTTMKVVVGKALKNQTPVLMAEMQFIEFMPYWNVPFKIVKDEILPKLMQNPGYLNRENMELVARGGSGARTVAFTEGTFSGLKQGSINIRQRPGKKNALGKVKFIFPNKDDVYLHDTPSVSLFNKTRRDLSHGCVRVSNPVGLAEFVLKSQHGWDKESILQAMRTPKMHRVFLKKPIPVMFFYITSFFDQDGNLAFYPDIYNLDAVLLEALKKPEDLSDQSLFVTSSVAPVETAK